MEKNTFTDYWILKPDGPSYATQDWKTVLNEKAKKKHQQTDCIVKDIREPIVRTADCVCSS